DHGVDLMVVYTEEAAPVYTDARDVATLLNKQFDGTVFVRTPVFTGSSSDTVPRHVLEAGQDDAAREHDPVASATVFAHKIPGPALGGDIRRRTRARGARDDRLPRGHAPPSPLNPSLPCSPAPAGTGHQP